MVSLATQSQFLVMTWNIWKPWVHSNNINYSEDWWNDQRRNELKLISWICLYLLHHHICTTKCRLFQLLFLLTNKWHNRDESDLNWHLWRCSISLNYNTYLIFLLLAKRLFCSFICVDVWMGSRRFALPRRSYRFKSSLENELGDLVL